MKSLVNEKVSHNKFGTGKIVEETGLKIWVQFSGADQPKIFAFPIAFEKFLIGGFGSAEGMPEAGRAEAERTGCGGSREGCWDQAHGE